MPRPHSPEPGASRDPWVARLLPRGLRRRVFLPAYYDMLLGDEGGPTGRSTRPMRVLGLLVESLGVGGFDWLVRDRRLLRAGRVALSIGLILITLGILVAAIGGDY